MESAKGVNVMQMQDYNNDENVLEKFGRNLNNEVKNGKMDPVIGRDEEIRNIIVNRNVNAMDRKITRT